jgi:small subunit ribosomal protein S9
VAEPTGVETPIEGELDIADHSPEEFPSEYTSESAPSSDVPARKPITTGNSYGTGRRKEAIARVRIMPGNGKWTIEGRSLENYFPNKVHQQIVKEPFVTLGAEDQFDVFVRLDGGGVTGQAGAVRMGLARALTALDTEVNRAPLKKAGFLTRDSREVERKKAGLKKARKAPQYSKR